jgi:hypothetical protein
MSTDFSKNARKTYREVAVQLHSFLTLVLDGVEWSFSCPEFFIPGKGPRYSLDGRLWAVEWRVDVWRREESLALTGI